jgi:hypothetical protein
MNLLARVDRDGKRNGGDRDERYSYTAYLEDNTLQRART